MSDRSQGAFARAMLLSAACLIVAAPALAQSAGGIAKPWSNEAELGFVKTSGNSSTTTFSLGDRFAYNWRYAELRLRLELFRTESTERVLTNEVDGVAEGSIDRVDAERYEVAAQFRQNVIGQLFWYALGDWYRNKPAGLENRWLGSGGVGYRLVDGPGLYLAAEAGVGLTREDRTNGQTDDFVDLRGFTEARVRLSDTADFAADLELLRNLQDSADTRVAASASLTARINRRLALRVGWHLKYDRQPPIVTVTTNPAAPPAAFVLDTTDQWLTTSLVLNF